MGFFRQLLGTGFSALAIMVMILPIAVGATEKQRIIWRVTNWPPFYIMNGPHQGEGLYDRMIKVYQEALPEYEHLNVEMTTMRALQQMKKRQDGTVICHVSMLLDSLTGFALNSELTSILPAHVIFAHADVADKIRALSKTNDNFVSIERLFSSPDFHGAHSSYGTHEVLYKYQYQENPKTNVVITSENYVSLGRLFANKRVDFIIQYEPFIRALLDQGMSLDEIEIIKIEETRQTPYVSVYAGCTHNDLGRMVIETINQVSAQKPQELQDARIQWLTGDTQKELMKLYEELAPDLNDYEIVEDDI